MKLERILEHVNSLEKNSFLKIIDNIVSSSPSNIKEIDKILSDKNNDLKSIDSILISKIFNLINEEFTKTIKAEFVNTSSQLDILIDIIMRDGNAIMKREWFAQLYEKELNAIKKRAQLLKKALEEENGDLDINRKRDYLTYQSCVQVAYYNDDKSNREYRITNDELSILITLARCLGLSQEEIKLINYLVIPPQKQDLDELINYLKNTGIIFYSKKSGHIMVADEVVKTLRKVRNKEIADKYYRRVLNTLREPVINLICRRHGIEIKERSFEAKVKSIILEGISFYNLLESEIHKEDTSLTERKKCINDLWESGLKISTPLRGSTIQDKINSIIQYFDEIEQDDKVGISVDGYERLLLDLGEVLPGINKLLQTEFEIQEDNVLNCHFLLDFNIKPQDVLDILTQEDLKKFVSIKEIKSRGDLVLNILEAYKDAENLYIENFENIGFRNLSVLKENGIIIKESELGLKFEELTKSIFTKLGFVVDEKLKKNLNTSKDKIDIVLNLGNNEIIIVECKTVKESGYNKFSSVSRQLKSYVHLAQNNGYNVVKSLLIAPDFSDDFINECDLEFEINLSLITANSLVQILDGLKSSKYTQLPYQLLMKDVLIKEDRIIKAIAK